MSNAQDLILHGAEASPFVRKVATALGEMGLEYEFRELIPFPKTPELLAMHPEGKIPILEHNGQYICDSSVICAYVDRLRPPKSLYPTDPLSFARALYLEEYADRVVMGSIAPVFGQRYVQVNVFGGTADEEIVQQALAEDIPPVFDYLETQMASDCIGLVHNEFSIADATLVNILSCLSIAGESISAESWPNLSSYLKRMLQRPVIAELHAPFELAGVA